LTGRFTAWRTLAAAVGSGVLFALAFPPYELPLLAPLALVPWIAALATEEKRWRGLVSGVLFGLTYWCVSIPWIHYVVTTFGGQSKTLGVLSVGILASILAQWPAAVGWATVAVAPRNSRLRLAVFPVLWLAVEHGRANVYGGFPWNLTAEALYRHPVWIQSASVMGAGRTAMFRKVIWPAALPYVLTGARLAFGRAWIGVIGGELLASPQSGLGEIIFNAKEFLNAGDMIAALIVIGILGLCFERFVFQIIEAATIRKWGMVSGVRP